MKTEKTVSIQVKSLKSRNSFIIDPNTIAAAGMYVFVIVNEAGNTPDFWIASGQQLLEIETELFGKWGRNYPKKHGRGFASSRIPDNWKKAWHNLGLL